jgi:hypothetical protein
MEAVTLSIVIAARNDNYGGDFLLRLQRSVDSIIHGAETARLPVELIIVEWNPPEDRPALSEAVILPEKSRFLALRIITVPKEQHARFGVKIPLIEYIAKNVGIRRAQGDFILVTNPDIYFPEFFFKTLMEEPLDGKAFYRTDRIDVTPPGAEFDALPSIEKEKLLSGSVLQANILAGTFPLSPGAPIPATENTNTGVSVCLPLRSIHDIYTNASGDFLLASRAAWFAIGAFKESTEYFTSIDSFCCFQLLSLGLKQRIFPSLCHIYHFDHSRNFDRLNIKRSLVDYYFYLDRLLDKISIIPINDESWGLADTDLPEQTLLMPALYCVYLGNDAVLYAQTLELLRRVQKDSPFEVPKKSTPLFIYNKNPEKAESGYPSGRLEYVPLENPPDFDRSSYLPRDKQSLLYTSWFFLPDTILAFQTFTIVLRFPMGSQGKALNYRCTFQDKEYAPLWQFSCTSSELEQEHKARIFYAAEQRIRLLLVPDIGKEYAIPEYLCINTDSCVMNFHDEVERPQKQSISLREKILNKNKGDDEMAPYLSIVTVSRNDDHGGDPQRRTQIFIDSYAWQAEHYKLETELILIDWNPPEGKPGLADILKFPANDYFYARVITVPPEIHKGFRHNKSLPIFQFIGKNAGIRRARGKFVLLTCMDTLLDDRLFEYIARKKLNKDWMYRADLYDVENTIPDTGHPEQQAFCRDPKNEFIKTEEPLQKFRRLWSNDRIPVKGLSRCEKIFPQHSFIDDDGVVIAQLKRRTIKDLNFYTCGDFTLMHKDMWNALRGHGEYESYSFHIDSQLLIHAYFFVEEVNFVPPLSCYHIRHGFQSSGSSFMSLGNYLGQLQKENVPILDWDSHLPCLVNILRQNPHATLNNERWGLRDINLEEFVFTREGRQHIPEANPISFIRPLSAIKPEFDFYALNNAIINNLKLCYSTNAYKYINKFYKHHTFWILLRFFFRVAVKSFLIISKSYRKLKAGIRKLKKSIRKLKTRLKARIKRMWFFRYLVVKRTKSLAGPQGQKKPLFIVTMTSYGKRVKATAPYAVASILNQTEQPDKIVLWLGYGTSIPGALKKLVNKGLEIRFTEDVGPHTKLVPALLAFPDDVLITADDDTKYTPTWFKQLKDAYKKDPARIYCHRANEMVLDNNYNARPVQNWRIEVSEFNNSRLMQFTGVCGVLYPPKSLHPLCTNKDEFKKLSPYNDDTWFWAMALLQGTQFEVLKGGMRNIPRLDELHLDGLWDNFNSRGWDEKQLQSLLDRFPELREIIKGSENSNRNDNKRVCGEIA